LLDREAIKNGGRELMIPEDEPIPQTLAIYDCGASSTFRSDSDSLAVQLDVAVSDSRVDSRSNENEIPLVSGVDSSLNRRRIRWNTYRC
jgi:hypothetical protein